MSEVTEIASEVINGYQVVRIFGGEDNAIKRFNQATEFSRRNDMKVAVSKAINVAGVQTIIALGISAIIFATIKLATVMTITAGSFLAIIVAMLQLIKPMKTLTTLNATIQRGLAGAESVFNLLNQPIELSEGRELKQKSKGIIEFNKVSFGYHSNKEILHEVSFKINEGETVALVGHSGSGKTTIASLLPRFYELHQGQILLDGINIQDLSLRSVRSQIALVSQQVTLFNDTIANNIGYGQPGVSSEEIIKAARFAFAEEFIENLPHGFETKIGENGVLLSGGQRQRIAMARAILKMLLF